MGILSNQIRISDAISIPKYDGWFTVLYNPNTKQFTARQKNHKVLVYKLTKDIENISGKDRIDILDYSLGQGNYDTKTEPLTVSDIFLHSKYIQLISERI